MASIISRWDRTSFYLNRIVYYAGFGAAALFMLSYLAEVLFTVAIGILICAGISVLLDTILLYQRSHGIRALRIVNERLSNGDENRIIIQLKNDYDFKINCSIIEELPMQFQERKWKRKISIPANASIEFEYNLKPVERGEYQFGSINVYVEGPLKLVRRRYISGQPQKVKVYPSFIQMRRYQLMAVGTQVQQSGVKRVRKLGHSLEFEQIKEYVRGD
ncbi:MAG: DUF58 domain-containing protein, partial [Flavisolibacter sp.]